MSQKRLLIIEDDVDVAEMLVTFFESQGYEVFSANEGNEGIALGRSKLPDLILLDVNLPDMDGFDVCRQLRTTTLTKYIPITFLTQRDTRADKVAGLELGADDYVTKPFDIEELKLRVQGSIRRATRDHLHEERTGLPSGPLIEEELHSLDGKSGWHHLDIVVTGFSAFREAYGFIVAGEALRHIAQLLTNTVTEFGTTSDFVGTPAEAHFVLLTHTADVNTLIRTIAERFGTLAQTFYNFEDAERGYVLINPGTANERHEPFMALNIVRVKSRETGATRA